MSSAKRSYPPVVTIIDHAALRGVCSAKRSWASLLGEAAFIGGFYGIKVVAFFGFEEVYQPIMSHQLVKKCLSRGHWPSCESFCCVMIIPLIDRA